MEKQENGLHGRVLYHCVTLSLLPPNHSTPGWLPIYMADNDRVLKWNETTEKDVDKLLSYRKEGCAEREVSFIRIDTNGISN